MSSGRMFTIITGCRMYALSGATTTRSGAAFLNFFSGAASAVRMSALPGAATMRFGAAFLNFFASAAASGPSIQ